MLPKLSYCLIIGATSDRVSTTSEKTPCEVMNLERCARLPDQRSQKRRFAFQTFTETPATTPLILKIWP